MNIYIVRILTGRPQSTALACFLLVLLLLSPALSFSTELTLGLDAAYIYDSNFYRSDVDEESADYMDIGGNISLEGKDERFSYSATYLGSYQKYWDYEEADAPEHRLRLQGQYEFSPLTTFRLKNTFRDVRNLNFSRQDILDGDSGLEPNNDRYQRNDLNLILHSDISRWWEIEFDAGHQLIDFDDNVNRSDSNSIHLGARLLYKMNQRNRLGGGLSWVTQDFDGGDFRLDSKADYIIADLVWVFDVTDQVKLTVNGGPAWVQTEEKDQAFAQQTTFVGGRQAGEVFRANIGSCQPDNLTGIGIASRCNFVTQGAEPIPADNLGNLQSFALNLGPQVGEDDDVTFFGGLGLLGRYADWTIDAELRRQQSATTGDAIAASVDRFRVDLGYAPPLARWKAYVAGSWERREALSNASIIDYTVIAGPEDAAQRLSAFTRIRDPDDRRDAMTALVGVGINLTQSLSTTAEIRFRRSERTVSGVTTEIDTHFFVLKISYSFDALRF